MTNDSTYAFASEYYDYLNVDSSRSAAAIAPLVCEQLQPASVLDVGCGQGAWLRQWQATGVTDVVGIDGPYVDRVRLLIPPDRFVPHDLTTPARLGRTFALVTSLEVAEHLPQAAAAGFVDTLARHGDVILFSAATPGQGGENHINEQPLDYWRALFRDQGFVAFDWLRPQISARPAIAPWYRFNSLLYVRQSAVPQLPAAIAAARIPDDRPVPEFGDLIWRLRRLVLRSLPTSMVTTLAVLNARRRAPRH